MQSSLAKVCKHHLQKSPFAEVIWIRPICKIVFQWDYSLLAVHMTAIYITVLLPPFSIWQHEGAAAWLFTLTAAMFAVTWDKLT